MKLDELNKKPISHFRYDIGDDNYWESRDSIEEFMNDRGFVKIGRGVFGEVYSHRDLNYILKLFSSSDDAYIEYLKFVAKNQNDQYLPKLRGRLIKITNEIYAVRMEKLKYIDNEEIIHLIKMIFYKPEDEHSAIALDKKYPGLSETIRKIAQIKEPFMSVDIHGGNVMFRGSTPVITDPFTGTKKR